MSSTPKIMRRTHSYNTKKMKINKVENFLVHNLKKINLPCPQNELYIATLLLLHSLCS